MFKLLSFVLKPKRIQAQNQLVTLCAKSPAFESPKISIVTSGVVMCYLVTLRVLHFNCNKQIVLRL